MIEQVRNKRFSTTAAATALLLLSFAFLYRHVIAKLVYDWAIDDNYSHGFLIVPLALYFVWHGRARILSLERRPSAWGSIVVLGSMAMLVAGVLGSELFLTRVSMLGTVAGTVLFLFGWKHLRALLAPICFLMLMIPVPAIIFNQIAFPLQLLASRFAELGLNGLGIPVLREGNVIQLAATSLEVAEACSGIRSLVSLLTLGIVYGYFQEKRISVRVLLAAATVPVAILANGFRVAGTGVAAHVYGEEAAQGFFHSFSGWVVFLTAFAILFVVHKAINLLLPPPRHGERRD